MRLEGTAPNEERAGIVATWLVADGRHSPVAHRSTVEDRLKAGIWRERGRRDDVVTSTARHGDPREHRVGRANGGGQARSGRVQVVRLMESAGRVGDALRRVASHPQRPGFVVSCAKTVTVALNR